MIQHFATRLPRTTAGRSPRLRAGVFSASFPPHVTQKGVTHIPASISPWELAAKRQPPCPPAVRDHRIAGLRRRSSASRSHGEMGNTPLGPLFHAGRDYQTAARGEGRNNPRPPFTKGDCTTKTCRRYCVHQTCTTVPFSSDSIAACKTFCTASPSAPEPSILSAGVPFDSSSRNE